MPEINLLQNTNIANSERRVHRTLNMVGVILLIVVVAGYAALFFLAKSADTAVAAKNAQEQSIQQSLVTEAEYPDFINHQDKLNNIAILLKGHLSWCTILPDFEQVTLKNAKYAKFEANSDGSATISGTVPDFQNLAKLIQGYQYGQNKFVKEVKLINVGLSSEEKNEISYTLNVKFNNEILKQYPTCN